MLARFHEQHYFQVIKLHFNHRYLRRLRTREPLATHTIRKDVFGHHNSNEPQNPSGAGQMSWLSLDRLNVGYGDGSDCLICQNFGPRESRASEVWSKVTSLYFLSTHLLTLTNCQDHQPRLPFAISVVVRRDAVTNLTVSSKCSKASSLSITAPCSPGC